MKHYFQEAINNFIVFFGICFVILFIVYFVVLREKIQTFAPVVMYFVFSFITILGIIMYIAKYDGEDTIAHSTKQ